ncbi:acetate kinase [Buchnera aphidicola]|nr:acetate kinase [Buchnera aphidicola]
MSKKFVLVLNCGSSSIKFSILNVEDGIKYLYGSSYMLYTNNFKIKWNICGTQYTKQFNKEMSYSDMIDYILKDILLKVSSTILRKIIGIGHRVVHGGDELKNSVIVDQYVINCIKKLSYLAPLHNYNSYLGIKHSIRLLSDISSKNIAVFDTAFHQTIPEEAYLYAIPYEFYTKHKIRRYGAHGISHNYITYETSKILNKSINSLNIISCHLGNGSSIAAIKNGKCIDTSMGFTPLEGLVMGTRSGDLDPSIIFFMNRQLQFGMDKISNILNKKSGLLGLNEKSSDCRYAVNNYSTDNASKRSIDVFCYKLSKYIGSYATLMDNRLDALIFTGGIGENSYFVRQLTVKNLSCIGLYLDERLNSLKSITSNFYYINQVNTIPIIVIQANEDLAIAKEVVTLINKI